MKTPRLREEKLGQGYLAREWLRWVSDTVLFGNTVLLEAKGVKP